jgi:ATP-dependent DNA helicase RecG
MRAEDLRKVISQGESLTAEFKGEEKGQLSDSEIVETVVCLANGQGGRLVIGVENDGRVTGARPRHGQGTDPLRIQSLISGRTVPPVTVHAQSATLEDKQVLVIEVPRAERPVQTTRGTSLRRALLADGSAGCVPYYFHELVGRETALHRLDYSAVRVPQSSWDELDPLQFERFRQMSQRFGGDGALVELSDLDLAKALGLVDTNAEGPVPTVAGLLLLGREQALQRHLPPHEVAFQVLRGAEVAVNEFYRRPLLEVVELLLERFDARNEEQEIQLGMFRLPIPDYARRSFREAVNNALIHRDYTKIGAVHVQWHTDRIEVSNPGGFVEGVRLDNLLVTPPRPRNPRLADAFKRCGLVERTGRGIDIIFEGQLRYGRPAPDYTRSTESSVTVILPGGPANLEFARVVVEEERAGRALSLEGLMILNHLERERRIDLPTAARLTQRGDAETRATLEEVVEAGLVEARGEKKGRTYHLSAPVYRRLGKPEAYVRTRGFEPIQQEQMVLQYVDSHGRISRREAADLCRISPYQATRLLNRLVASGRLGRRGQGRTTYYERL